MSGILPTGYESGDMRWQRGRSSGNTIDARGSRMPGGRVAVPGGLGLVGVIVFVAFQLLSGGSGFAVPSAFDDGAQAPGGSAIPAEQDPERDLRDFSEYVFDSTQSTWAKTFGGGYRDAKLYLYRDAVSTGCGSASAAVGPFYCPADQRVYLDLSFYRDMENQLGAPGDFAWAYVIAHEVGHHVQKLRGTSDDVQRLQRQDPDQANPLSVRLELQADCYAGVWAHSVFDQLDPGDVEEAITASEAVGDDRLQRRARGEVRPDSFTHGTSAQRAKWFSKGQANGEPADCDTFSVDEV
jgi:predicted metalloprotease